MSVDTKLKELIINTLSPEQLPEHPSETELYLVEDDAEYATVEELAEGLAGKQDTLIPGANITITDNVISAAGDVASVNGKTGTVVLTGEDIAADVSELTDTVQGHLQTLHDNIKDIELFKFPNATIIGEPIIQNGQVSGFTANDYLQFPFIVDLHNQPFVIDFCFTTGDDVTTQQNILDSQFGLALAIANGKGLMAISHNGTSWAGSVVGTMTINPNTTYYARLSWNRINYQTQLSTDGTTYTPDMNFGSTQSPYPRTMFIGGCSGSAIGHTPHPFKGTINMNYAYLTVAGNVIWQGMDDAGLATRMASDVSNITEEGKERIKQIVGSVASDSIQDQNPLEGVDKIWSGAPEQLPEEKANDTFYATFEAGKTPVPYRISVAERNIGETVFSLIPLMDSGLHLLDGDNIDGTGVYAQFYQKMVELQSVAPQCFISEEDWQAEVSAHGVCGKFVLDTASQTVRLPKLKNGILTDNAVVGNGMTLGVTNGTTNYGVVCGANDYYTGYTGAYGTNVGTTRSGSAMSDGKGYGLVTDGTKSGIIVDSATQGYYYIVLANTIKQPIEADVDQILEQVNTYTSRIEDMESHKVIEFQIPTEENGYTWYRLYADGWVEQGGFTLVSDDQRVTVTLPIEMANVGYKVLFGNQSSTYTASTFALPTCLSKTTTSFDIGGQSNGGRCDTDWEVKGMVK